MEEEVEEHIPRFISKWKELQWLCMESTPSSFNEMLMEINTHCKDFMGLVTRGWISDEEALEIVKFLPTIKFLYLRGSFMSKETLIKIIEGCRELKLLDVKDCLGLEIDDETLKKASGIETFVYGGSLLEQNDYDDGDDDEDNDGGSNDIIIFYDED
ncbi:uncharacterized protein LOC131245548 [Magnolia sinica]|uniref:uncharacterized protein LOC131245548 n=1 Tax=Magnolia sinica TaxID=86752 RepID=UPI002659D05E|nr:uncharacterized protein LOC131245548 [Magnolia sinica]